MTENNSPQTEPTPKPSTEKTISRSASATATPKSATAKDSSSTEQNNRKRSKTAVLALLCSLTAIAGIGGGYYWQQLQHQDLAKVLLAENGNQLQKSEENTQQQTAQQLAAFKQQIDTLIAEQDNQNQQQLTSLSAAVNQLSQNNPSDWLVYEAEYLIRIAARGLWLEQNANTAINLLNEADSRLNELDDPKYLSIRQVIHRDIELLAGLPVLATDEVLLSLLALDDQIALLPIAMAYVPEADEDTQDFELSDKTEDWYSNLEKTWRKFIADFISVKHRTANVEALLTPQQQQSLRHNLSLQLQLAQWAVTRRNQQLYTATLTKIGQWLTQYFDVDSSTVINFQENIKALEQAIITIDVPKELDSLAAIRSVIKSKPVLLPVDQNKEPLSPEQVIEAEPSEDLEQPAQPASDDNDNGATI